MEYHISRMPNKETGIYDDEKFYLYDNNYKIHKTFKNYTDACEYILSEFGKYSLDEFTRYKKLTYLTL